MSLNPRPLRLQEKRLDLSPREVPYISRFRKWYLTLHYSPKSFYYAQLHRRISDGACGHRKRWLPICQRCINMLQGQTYTMIDSLLCVRMLRVQITSGSPNVKVSKAFNQGWAPVLFKRTQRSCVLYKRTERFLRSFPFFIKERNDLCVLSRSL